MQYKPYISLINIANNAPVKMIKLNNPTGLSLSNLNELETLSINLYFHGHFALFLSPLSLTLFLEDWLQW